MEVMLPELAAVVAGGDLDDARPAGGSESGAQCLLDRRSIETIDNDLEYRVHAFGQLALDALAPAQRRTVGIVRGCDHLLVFLRAHLAAGAHDAARKRENDAAYAAHRLDCGFRGGERFR